MQSPKDILGPEGPFARLIAGFQPRPQQQSMAEAVAAALDREGVLVAEAGTGTGKTFAYLVPALRSRLKVIVSTGTRNLQDQLFGKDLPIVREALGAPVDVALLKGRANYLCRYRLAVSAQEGRFRRKEEVRQFAEIDRWAARTRTGDIAETGLPESSPLWPAVTSTAENCLGSDCPQLDSCCLIEARRRAQEADVVVVNHHLLFADMAIRDSGFGELLPQADAYILDEAHQVPEIASTFFAESIGGNQLKELARDSITAELQEAGEERKVARAAEALERCVADLRLALGGEARRAAWHEALELEGLTARVGEVSTALAELEAILEPLAQRGKGLDGCRRRAAELREQFDRLTGDSPEGYIHWFETFTRAFTITLTPMDVAEVFRQRVKGRGRSWVFTSATLTVDGRFDHFLARLGIRDAECEAWDSPFEYTRQALFYVPRGLPEPNAADYTEAVVEQALPVIEASGGRTFMLFTSHRALAEAGQQLKARCSWPLLLQGEAPRHELLERFRRLGNAVLLGTGSFWEGVDVRGEALSCVIIDKLPFASPGDPVLQARIEAMREQGGNPFMQYQLPHAVIILKQGVGRLIRDVEDRGVLMICDPRLLSKPYGKVFLHSLPRMLQTRSLEVVQRFFALDDKLPGDNNPSATTQNP